MSKAVFVSLSWKKISNFHFKNQSEYFGQILVLNIFDLIVTSMLKIKIMTK